MGSSLVTTRSVGDHEEQDEIMSEPDGAQFSSAAEDGEGQYGGDEDDVCCICKDGGELMVCDGGVELDGCDKTFHATCVDRDEIPQGDWVCQDCAKTGGLTNTERRGHEFGEEV